MIRQLSAVFLIVAIQRCLSVNAFVKTSNNGAQGYFLKKNRTIYIGAMGPIAGSRHISWGAGIIESMKLAIDIINRRSDILPEYKLQLVPRNTKGYTGYGTKVFYDLVTKKKILLILGPARSNVAEPTATMAKFLNVIQVSPSASLAKLSNSYYYPWFFRTLPSLVESAKTFVALARHFNWTRVGVVYYGRDWESETAFALRRECIRSNITVAMFGSYLYDSSDVLKNLKELDVRIVFAFLVRTTGFMCKIYQQSMNRKEIAWVIHTQESRPWWNRTFDSVPCTPAEVYDGARNVLSISYSYLSSSERKTVSRLTPQEFTKSFLKRCKLRGISDTLFKGFAFDAAWLVALALNQSTTDLKKVLGTNATLDNVPFGNKSFTVFLKKLILGTKFEGITGAVELNKNGDRVGLFDVEQLQGNSLVKVCQHHVGNVNLLCKETNSFYWKGGKPPVDRIKKVIKIQNISFNTFVIVTCISIFGICLSTGFLIFNISYRQTRIIKMSSPNLNNLIILGSMMAYSSVILFAFGGDMLTSLVCKFRPILLSLAFTLAFGAMFSKTWRVHRLTRRSLGLNQKMAIQDRHLFGVIVILLLVDSAVLITWMIVDPITNTTSLLSNQIKQDSDNSIQYIPKIYYCSMRYTKLWVGFLCGYKGILLLFGMFLAWETKNVRIPALNDSQNIGMAVYSVVITCAVGVPLVLFFGSKQQEVSLIIHVVSILSCTTVTLCLVFVPKITALRDGTRDCETPNFFTIKAGKASVFVYNPSQSSEQQSQRNNSVQMNKLAE